MYAKVVEDRFAQKYGSVEPNDVPDINFNQLLRPALSLEWA